MSSSFSSSRETSRRIFFVNKYSNRSIILTPQTQTANNFRIASQFVSFQQTNHRSLTCSRDFDTFRSSHIFCNQR
ncbi:hypothetical protein P8452_72016 [Trifolium repens]|nr:hypothetical protein P8452_72016 [Trifolium repens]